MSDSDVGIAEGAGPYQDVSGGHATRIVTPNCAEGSCTWTEVRFPSNDTNAQSYSDEREYVV